MKLEMQIKFSGRMRPLSSESFISLFTNNGFKKKKSVLYTTVTVPVYVQGRKTWSLTLREKSNDGVSRWGAEAIYLLETKQLHND
jgi:hypothetical protein